MAHVERVLRDERNPKTVVDVIDAYLADRRPHIAHPGSLEAHAKALREFFAERTLAEICERNVLRNLCHDFAEWRSGLKVNTIRKQLIILQSALRLAWKRGVITGLPVMWIPEAQKADRREFLEEDIAAVLTTADAYPTEPHIRSFVYLTVFTGQHMGKVLGLRWKEVNFPQGAIHFFKRDGSKERVVMHPRLRAVLERAYDARQSDYVVEWRGKQVANVYQGMKQLFDRAGLKSVSTLDLRLFHNAQRDDETPKSDDGKYVFVSYCRRDGTEKANLLIEEFKKLEQRFWIDHLNMQAGNYSMQLTDAIKQAAAVVLVLTEGANDSADVLQEVARAKTANVPVLPISVKNVGLGPELRFFFERPHVNAWGVNAEETAIAALATLGLRDREDV